MGLFTRYISHKLDYQALAETYKNLILVPEYQSMLPELKDGFSKRHLKITTPDNRYTFYMDGPYWNRITMRRVMTIWLRDNQLDSSGKTTIYELDKPTKWKEFKNIALNYTISPPQQTAPSPEPTLSSADELIKFKQLLDMGVLTQEEFDMKKAEFLNQSLYQANNR